jgi:SAM-dependent methyltransferase
VSGRDAFVAAQYEGYPYPERNPDDERKRLVLGSPSDLAEIRHYLCAGRLPATGREPFRALIAGGGTGDAAIMQAQQCTTAGLHAEITYLDLSATARSIAEARARVRGLTNIRFESGSLLDAARIAPGPFDYIDCCGVLHHLEDPAAGLAALTAVLKPAGGMGLMVYGEYGRRGVYETQEVLRALASTDLPDRERIARTKRLLQHLPKTNWLRRNPFIQDHREGGDAGLYDLLLHSRDRAFRVRELADLLAGAGMAISAFIQPAAYNPSTYLSDDLLLKSLANSSMIERAAIAEALAGNIRKHVVYATWQGREEATVATPTALDSVPVLHRQSPRHLAEAMRSGSLKLSIEGFETALPVPRRAAAVVFRINGSRSFSEIAADLQVADRAPSTTEAMQITIENYYFLTSLNFVLIQLNG